VDVAGLRLEHHALGAHVDTLRMVADGIGVVDAETTLAGVDNLHEFLTHHLLPHARAEEAVLYPLIDRLMGAADATATMRSRAGGASCVPRRRCPDAHIRRITTT
jgi:iron-sulfur cluster repair protein YtfE (RIC family)